MKNYLPQLFNFKIKTNVRIHFQKFIIGFYILHIINYADENFHTYL